MPRRVPRRSADELPVMKEGCRGQPRTVAAQKASPVTGPRSSARTRGADPAGPVRPAAGGVSRAAAHASARQTPRRLREGDPNPAPAAQGGGDAPAARLRPAIGRLASYNPARIFAARPRWLRKEHCIPRREGYYLRRLQGLNVEQARKGEGRKTTTNVNIITNCIGLLRITPAADRGDVAPCPRYSKRSASIGSSDAAR